VLKRAGLPHRTFQNLCATASSLLKQWGISRDYVLAAIGLEIDLTKAVRANPLGYSGG
jgi:hypothetical protein